MITNKILEQNFALCADVNQEACPGKTRRYFFPLFSLNVVKCKNDSNEVNSNNFPCHGIHISYTSHIVEYSMVMEFEVPYFDKKVDDFCPFITSSQTIFTVLQQISDIEWPTLDRSTFFIKLWKINPRRFKLQVKKVL